MQEPTNKVSTYEVLWEVGMKKREQLVSGAADEVTTLRQELAATKAQLEKAECLVDQMIAGVIRRSTAVGAAGLAELSEVLKGAIQAPTHSEGLMRALKRQRRGAREERREHDPEQAWQEFWAEIVAPGGNLDLACVKAELSDYSVLLDFVPRVYGHVTGGRITKPNTWPSVVCAVADDVSQEELEDFIADHGQHA